MNFGQADLRKDDYNLPNDDATRNIVHELGHAVILFALQYQIHEISFTSETIELQDERVAASPHVKSSRPNRKPLQSKLRLTDEAMRNVKVLQDVSCGVAGVGMEQLAYPEEASYDTLTLKKYFDSYYTVSKDYEIVSRFIRESYKMPTGDIPYEHEVEQLIDYCYGIVQTALQQIPPIQFSNMVRALSAADGIEGAEAIQKFLSTYLNPECISKIRKCLAPFVFRDLPFFRRKLACAWPGFSLGYPH